MADFHVVPHAPATSAHPGGCYLCKCDQRQDPRTGALEPMIDTLVELDLASAADDLANIQFLRDQPGRSLVICQSCVFEMATMLGAVAPTQAEMLRAECDELYGRLQDAEEARDLAQESNRVLVQNLGASFGIEPPPAEEMLTLLAGTDPNGLAVIETPEDVDKAIAEAESERGVPKNPSKAPAKAGK